MLEKNKVEIPAEGFQKKATIYKDSERETKASILYFHGGGLVCGSREDLPDLHLERLTQAGYKIIAFDYPLAPGAKIDQILSDVIDSIHWHLDKSSLPYFLFGRSSGAYLCLLAAASGKLKTPPTGLLSYYGYGLLVDNWYREPNTYYQTLPKVPENCLDLACGSLYCEGEFFSHYSIYVYARQTGKWKDLFYEGREKFFLLDFSLRTKETLPCPLFCAHSTGDTDVPFQEFLSLCNRYNPKRFIASGKEHVFDRDTQAPQTKKLIEESIQFLDSCL